MIITYCHILVKFNLISSKSETNFITGPERSLMMVRIVKERESLIKKHVQNTGKSDV